MGINPALEMPNLLSQGQRSTPQLALDIDSFAFLLFPKTQTVFYKQ